MKKLSVILMILLLMGCSSSAKEEYNELIPDSKPDTENIESVHSPAENVDADGWYVLADGDSTVIEESEAESAQEISPYVEETDPSVFDGNRLDYEEFADLNDDIRNNGVPKGRENLALKRANGVWRYNFKSTYKENGKTLSYDELGYAEMYVNGADQPPIRITQHPRKASDGYGIWEVSDESAGYEPFAGYIDDDNVIRLKGNSSVLIPEHYYAYQGKEYLIGKLYMKNDRTGDFLMIRERKQ